MSWRLKYVSHNKVPLALIFEILQSVHHAYNYITLLAYNQCLFEMPQACSASFDILTCKKQSRRILDIYNTHIANALIQYSHVLSMRAAMHTLESQHVVLLPMSNFNYITLKLKNVTYLEENSVVNTVWQQIFHQEQKLWFCQRLGFFHFLFKNIF